MKHILVYGDSVSWGIIPGTRNRLNWDQRWTGVLEMELNKVGYPIRIIEDCLNGRRTVWEDPFKPGRNGLKGLAQKIEISSPLELVILLLGTNDFQSVHNYSSWHSAQGLISLISAIRQAPIEPGMSVPQILIIVPPKIQSPKGLMRDKFLGGDEKYLGLPEAYKEVASLNNCHYFDSNTVIHSSNIDGVHLDEGQHRILALSLVPIVGSIIRK